MMNKGTDRDLLEAGISVVQPQVAASHIPDWTQFVTKQDMSQLENRLIR